MNALERVLAVMEGKPTDRPAFFLNLSLYGARLTGHAIERHYTDASAYIEGQLAVFETIGPDLVLSPFLIPALGEAFGSTTVQRGLNVPNLKNYAARSAREALALPIPEVDSHPRLVYLRECVRELAKKTAGQVAIVGALPGPVDLPIAILGLDAWLDALLFDPNAAQALLERCGSFFVSLANAMLADGAHLITLTLAMANPGVVGVKAAGTLIAPVLQTSFQQVRGPIVAHHGGYCLVPHLEWYKGLPNTVGWVVDPRDSLAEAREILGPGPVLLGNLEAPALDRPTPEAIRQQCQALLTDRAKDPHFILATSQADIPHRTPLENILAIRNTVHSFRNPPE